MHVNELRVFDMAVTMHYLFITFTCINIFKKVISLKITICLTFKSRKDNYMSIAINSMICTNECVGKVILVLYDNEKQEIK